MITSDGGRSRHEFETHHCRVKRPTRLSLVRIQIRTSHRSREYLHGLPSLGDYLGGYVIFSVTKDQSSATLNNVNRVFRILFHLSEK